MYHSSYSAGERRRKSALRSTDAGAVLDEGRDPLAAGLVGQGGEDHLLTVGLSFDYEVDVGQIGEDLAQFSGPGALRPVTEVSSISGWLWRSRASSAPAYPVTLRMAVFMSATPWCSGRGYSLPISGGEFKEGTRTQALAVLGLGLRRSSLEGHWSSRAQMSQRGRWALQTWRPWAMM